MPGLICAILAVIGALAAPTGPGTFAASPAPSPKLSPQKSLALPLPLAPVYRFRTDPAKPSLATARQLNPDQARPDLEGIAFRAVLASEWPAGLVPLFLVEKTNRFELRRRPRPGQENYTEALFFALPASEEEEAGKVAGWWDCQATRADGAKEHLAWELTIEGERVAGRFDQNTQYRFAYLMGGTFRSNRLELRVEYGRDAYLLEGRWEGSLLKGRWHKTDEAESGAWQASQPDPPVLPRGDPIALYEWRRSLDGAVRYATETEDLGPEWKRPGRPLCRVWRAEEGAGANRNESESR